MPWLRSGEQFSTSPLDINADEVSRSAIYRPANPDLSMTTSGIMHRTDVRATIAKLLYSASGHAPRPRSGAAAIRHGLARRRLATLIWTSMLASSRGLDFAAASTGTATSTVIGNCWRRLPAPK